MTLEELKACTASLQEQVRSGLNDVLSKRWSSPACFLNRICR